MFRQISRCYGIPEDTVSDRGVQLTSHILRTFSQQLTINVSCSSSYYPQTNGQKNFECMNQESGRSLFSSNQHHCRNASSTSPLTSHTSSRIPTCNSSMVWWTKPKFCQTSWWIDEKAWTDLGSSICSSTLGNPKTVSSWKEAKAASTTMPGANGLVVHQQSLPEISLLEVPDSLVLSRFKI